MGRNDYTAIEMRQFDDNRRRLWDAVRKARAKQSHLPLRQVVRECVAEMMDEHDSEIKPDGR